jgi:hypothetical protein
MRGRLRSVLHFVGGEAWRVRCSSRFRGVGASDAGESSQASATRARRKDSGRQEARGRDPHTESMRRAVQFSTRKHSVMPVSRRTPAQEQQPSTQTARADVASMPVPRHHPFAPTHPRQRNILRREQHSSALLPVAPCRPRFAGVGFWARLHLAGILQAFPETHRKEVLPCPP